MLEGKIITKEIEHTPAKFRWQAYREPVTGESDIGWGVDEAAARQDLLDIEAGINVGARPAKVPRF